MNRSRNIKQLNSHAQAGTLPLPLFCCLSLLLMAAQVCASTAEYLIPLNLQRVNSDNGMYFSCEMELPVLTFATEHTAHSQSTWGRDYATIELDTSIDGTHGHFFTPFFVGSNCGGSQQIEWKGTLYGEVAERSGESSGGFLEPWAIFDAPKSDVERELELPVGRLVKTTRKHYSWPFQTVVPGTSTSHLSSLHQVAVDYVPFAPHVSVRPFVAANVNVPQDSVDGKVGADISWRPTPDFKFDSSILPDFGTVEADDVIINLSVFETFYADRRELFTEKTQVFDLNALSPSGIVPFHSRRLGQRMAFPRNRGETDLQATAQVVGKQGNWDFAFLGATEDDSKSEVINVAPGPTLSINLPGRDFGVIRLLYTDTESRELSFGMLTAARFDQLEGNAVSYMFDGRYASSDQSVIVDSNIFVSDTEYGKRGFGGLANVQLRPTPERTHLLTLQRVDDDLDLNAVGYNRRNDQTRISYKLTHTDENPYLFRSISTEFSIAGVWNSEGERTNNNISLSRSFVFYDFNRASVSVSVMPSFLDDTVAYRVEEFRTDNAYRVALEWVTNSEEQFHYGLNTGYRKSLVDGGFFWFGGEFSLQPTDSFKASLRLSKAFRDGWLRFRANGRYTRFESWGPRAEISAQYAMGPDQLLQGEFQWESIHGKGLEFYEVPDGANKLVSLGGPSDQLSDSFAISQVVMQIRYKWEVTPLSDVSVAYTKFASRNYLSDNSTIATLRDQLQNPDTENFAIKVRYLFSN